MARRRPPEIHVHHERWLVSYADFITLLFAFFVVMYAISHVNEGKYKVLSQDLTEAFGLPPVLISDPIQVGEIQRGAPIESIKDSHQHDGPMDGDVVPPPIDDFGQLASELNENLSEFIEADDIRIKANEFWLEIELRSSILFPAGTVNPSEDAKDMLEEIALLFKRTDNPIQVEGFTDNTPINSALYPSNWELSSARASMVVKEFILAGVAPQRLSAVGYGEFQPLADNNTEQGRNQNRRVVLMVAREKVKRPIVAEHGALSVIDAVVDATGQSVNPEPVEKDGVQRVKLKNGGLLFTSDPDLPRENTVP